MNSFRLAQIAAVLLLFVGCSRPLSPPDVSVAALDPSLASLILTSRAAVVSAPGSAESWGRLGQSFHAAEFLPEAMTCYRQAEQLDPNSSRWAHLLGVLEMAENPGTALEHLKRAAALGGERADVSRLRLARLLEERGVYDVAAAELRIILARDKNSPAAQLALGRVLFAQGRLDAAAESLTPLTVPPGGTREAALLLAQIRQRQGAAEEATQLARRAATLQIGRAHV